MKFKMEIELGNDAMKTLSDIGRALNNLARWFIIYHPRPDSDVEHEIEDLVRSHKIQDINGNSVGFWSFEK